MEAKIKDSELEDDVDESKLSVEDLRKKLMEDLEKSKLKPFRIRKQTITDNFYITIPHSFLKLIGLTSENYKKFYVKYLTFDIKEKSISLRIEEEKIEEEK
jgi:hypothetical protein